MTRVRHILDALGRDTLVRLTEERDLGPRTSNDERRSSLAKSFKGDFEELFQSLKRSELIQIFHEFSFVIGDTEMCLSGPTRYRRPELIELAIDAFERAAERAEFSLVDGEPEEDDEDFDEDDEEDNDVEDGEDEDDEEEREDVDEDDDVEVSVADVFPRVGTKWSGPRKVAPLMKRLGYDVPQRLRTRRFHEMIASLSKLGLEVAYVDLTPVHPDDRSPGIESKLRLRLLSAGERRKNAPRRRRVSQPPPQPRPVVPVSRGPVITTRLGDFVADPAPSVSPYNLALLRLQLLTAVPCFERKHESTWPYAYLNAAVRGLEVSAPEANLLKSVAVGLCMGTHSPFPIVQRLMRHLNATAWDELLADLERLNRMHGDVVATIVEHVLGLLPQPGAAMASADESARDLVDQYADTQPSTERKAASSQRATSRSPGGPRESERPEELNRRVLGPLDDMFD